MKRGLIFGWLIAALFAVALGVAWVGLPALTGRSAAPISPAAAVHAEGAERAPAGPAFWPPEAKSDAASWTGRLLRVSPHLATLTVRGSAEERGTAHGKLLGAEVRALVASVKKFLRPNDEKQKEFAECLDGAHVMKKHIEADVLKELSACAAAAEADEDELLLAQLFGDVNRAKGFRTFCTSFAAFGPATAGGRPIVGRNFDYAGMGLEGGLPLILQELPRGAGAGRPFVTVGYAGILNGWTALNADGLCAGNNTLFGGSDVLEGTATCFLLRQIVERARNIEEAVEIIERGPRACTTGMLVAGKNREGRWDARLVEFDAKKVAVVPPVNGFVLGSNTRQRLEAGAFPPSENPACARFQALRTLLQDHAGKLDFAVPGHNPAGAKGVYMGINLHCALLDLEGQRLRLAVSPGDGTPAAEHPFRLFRVLAERVEELKE